MPAMACPLSGRNCPVLSLPAATSFSRALSLQLHDAHGGADCCIPRDGLNASPPHWGVVRQSRAAEKAAAVS